MPPVPMPSPGRMTLAARRGQLFVGSGLLELRAEVVDGGIDELRVGVRLALDPLGVPVVLVEAGGLLFLGSFPILVDGRGNAGVKLQLRAVGEHEAARAGRVAAHHLLLLGEHDLLARQRRRHGRRQAGIAGADDEDVRLLVEADRLVTHHRSVGAALGRLRAVRTDPPLGLQPASAAPAPATMQADPPTFRKSLRESAMKISLRSFLTPDRIRHASFRQAFGFARGSPQHSR